MLSEEQADSHDHRADVTAPHDRSSALSYMRLKLSSVRTSQVSRKSIRPELDTATVEMPIVRKTTILDLPVEIIHTIRDFATVASRACLALTCHHLLHYIGTRVFTDLDYNNTRLEKATFLQTLQKDRPDPKLGLCYGCLRFHPVTQRYDPPNFRAVRGNEGVGFPKCRSTYALALDDIHSRLKIPKSKWATQMHWMEDDITSPVRMQVSISCLSDTTDLMMRRRYHISYYRAGFRPDPRFLSEVQTVTQLLETLRLTNLEICPHICFARVWQGSDCSVMSALNNLKELDCLDEGHNPIFQCVECRLDVEVQLEQDKATMVVRVWQHVGQLAYPSDQNESDEGHKSLYTDGAAPQYLVEQKQKKLLPVLVDERSKWRRISLFPTRMLRPLWRKTLNRMKRSKSEAAMVPMLAPVQQQQQSPGEMKRRWESLAMLEATAVEEECKQLNMTT